MKKIVLTILVVLNLVVTSVFSPFAKSAPLSLGTTSPVPVSPLPSDAHGSHESDAVSSDAVWELPTDQHSIMLIKTRQNGLGWWDADGKLHIAPQIDGLVAIPLLQAVMISIPGDAVGVPVPPGWRKLMRPENGEWVIVRAT